MIEFVQSVKGFFNRFSTMEVLGFPIDWFFHLAGVAVVAIVATRFVPRRIVIRLALILIAGKELFDVFAKTRLEYIRPPGIDLLFDVTAGLAGLALGLWIAGKWDARRGARA